MEEELTSSTKIQCYISPSTGDRIRDKIRGIKLERANLTKGTVEVLKKF